MSERRPGFIPERMAAVAKAACQQVGLPKDDIRFQRLGQNILYHLPGPDLVVRIARDSSYYTDALKELAVATWLADEQIPAARVCDIGREQPLCVEGHPVTFWHYVPGRTATRTEAPVIGDLLRRLHQLPTPKGLPIPQFRPLARVEHRIHSASVPEDDKMFLTETKTRLEATLDDLSYTLPYGINHGDAHIKNTIVSPDGTNTLIDFEAVNMAHHEWDLAKIATEAAMGMLPEKAYVDFATAYGHDITEWDGFTTARSVMQLRMITWLAQNLGHTDAVADEYRKRVLTLRNGLTESWSGF